MNLPPDRPLDVGLLHALARRVAPGAHTAKDAWRLSGGASQETWTLDAVGNGDPIPLILRRAPGGARSGGSGEAVPLATEAAVIRAAGAAGAPVPTVLHVCDEADGLGEAYVMARLAGETIPRRILTGEAFAAVRPKLAAQCGAILARIHATPLEALPDLTVSDPLDQLERYEAVYRTTGGGRPVMELAIRWLRETAPPPLPPTLVHGDFRHGNLMIDPSGVVAVLDWELTHLGDPREDIGWICVNSWRFGVRAKTVGGFGDLTDLLEAYADAGGVRVTPEQARWFEALGSFKWGVMCLIMYEAWRTGLDRSVERAVIGRRASEAEIDLLNLIEMH
jgi:aminoglycoside phosphotransferase (APT) family kinase protein